MKKFNYNIFCDNNRYEKFKVKIALKFLLI